MDRTSFGAKNTFCDCALATLVNMPLPFTVAHLLDYYDGEVAGILQSSSDPTELYTFEMIGWHRYGPLRVYALSPCQPSDLAEMLEVSPDPVAGLPSDQLKVNWDAAQQIMTRTWAPQFIMAWEIYANRILAIRELPREMQAQVAPYMAEESDERVALNEAGERGEAVNWFDFLQLAP